MQDSFNHIHQNQCLAIKIRYNKLSSRDSARRR